MNPEVDLDAADQIGQRQFVRQENWVLWAVGGLGFAWPFIVALFGLVLTGAAGFTLSIALENLLFGCSLLGTPVVIGCFYRWLPTSWLEVGRFMVAVLLAVPCVLVELFLALILFFVVYPVE
jgi:hypothetical protein